MGTCARCFYDHFTRFFFNKCFKCVIYVSSNFSRRKSGEVLTVADAKGRIVCASRWNITSNFRFARSNFYNGPTRQIDDIFILYSFEVLLQKNRNDSQVHYELLNSNSSRLNVNLICTWLRIYRSSILFKT